MVLSVSIPYVVSSDCVRDITTQSVNLEGQSPIAATVEAKLRQFVNTTAAAGGRVNDVNFTEGGRGLFKRRRESSVAEEEDEEVFYNESERRR